MVKLWNVYIHLYQMYLYWSPSMMSNNPDYSLHRLLNLSSCPELSLNNAVLIVYMSQDPFQPLPFPRPPFYQLIPLPLPLSSYIHIPHYHFHPRKIIKRIADFLLLFYVSLLWNFGVMAKRWNGEMAKWCRKNYFGFVWSYGLTNMV